MKSCNFFAKLIVTVTLVGSLAFVGRSGTFAQPIAPVHSEYIFPSYTGYWTGSPFYNPLYNSAYSYFRVNFNIDGAGTWENQDLYVYTWSGSQYLHNGLAWIRRDHATNTILDQGYINLPSSQTSHEVGILQDESGEVYVVIAYLENAIPHVSLHQWKYWGVNPMPCFTQNIQFYDAEAGAASLSYGHRISLDCIHLKKIALAWEEVKQGSANKGGIFVKVGAIGEMCSLDLSNSLRIDATDSSDIAPDIAFGSGGSDVYIAYIHQNGTTGDGEISVMTDSYSNIISDADVTASTFSIIYSTGYPSTFLVTPIPYRNHVRIDAPDNNIQPIWAVVYLADWSKLNTIVRAPSGVITHTTGHYPSLNSFCTPAVAYSPDLSYIALSWFNQSQSRYLGTRIDITGTTYIPPATSTQYYVVNSGINDGSCVNWGVLAYSTSQQPLGTSAHQGLFISYGMLNSAGPTYEMRTKVVRYLPPSIPFAHWQEHPNYNVKIYPNPLSSSSQLYIEGYQDEPISITLTDILGRVVWSKSNTPLTQINQDIGSVVERLNGGIYHFRISRGAETVIIKCIKK